MQFLIDDLAHRRAFADEAVYIEGASSSEDFRRATASVLGARDAIGAVRSRAGSSPAVHRVLSEMTRACNAYLEDVDSDPNSYAIGLARLRDKLKDGVQRLAQARGVDPRDPGSWALGDDRA